MSPVGPRPVVVGQSISRPRCETAPVTSGPPDRPQRRPRRGLRRLAARGRRGPARHRDQRERGLRLPRRGPLHHAPGVRPGGRRRGRRRRAGVLPRPGRVRPPVHRRRAGRTGRRRALPARRARRDRPRRRRPGVLRQAARRALQRGRHPRGAGRGGGGGRAGLRPPLPVLGLPGSALLRTAEAAGLRPVQRGVRRPRLHRPPAPWCRAASPAPWCTTRRWSPSARCGWPPTATSSRWTARRCSWPSSRCACTATPRARWRWPARCGRRWRLPGSTVAAFDRLRGQSARRAGVGRAQPPGEQVRGDVVDRPAAAVGVRAQQVERGGGADLEVDAELADGLPDRGPAPRGRPVQPLRAVRRGPRRPDGGVAQRGGDQLAHGQRLEDVEVGHLVGRSK